METNFSHPIQKKPGGIPGNRVLDEPAVYEFIVARALSAQLAGWFEGLDVVQDEGGNTRLQGTLVDQAALHGVLAKIRDFNLILLAVVRK